MTSKVHLSCSSCNSVLPTNCFYKNNKTTRGYMYICKSCYSFRHSRAARNLSNRKYYKKTRKQQYNNDPSKYLWQIASKRAKKFNIPFNIEISDILIPEYCPITGQKLDILIEDKKQSYQNAASLDKIDNSLGYIKGNVRVISRKANRMKSDLTIEQVENLLKYMKGDV